MAEQRKEPGICMRLSMIALFLGLTALFLALTYGVSMPSEEDLNKQTKLSKPFGLGGGPFFLTSEHLLGWKEKDHTNITYGIEEVTKLITDIYSQYVNYKRLTGQVTSQELEYYKKWYKNDECMGGCESFGSDGISSKKYESQCLKGFCHCMDKQVFGRCINIDGQDDEENMMKYRRPKCHPYCLPEDCYEVVELNFKQIKRIKSEMSSKTECQEDQSLLNTFDHLNLPCAPSDPKFCSSKDLNMVCNEGTQKCECRQDMAWNKNTMECEIHLDLNCPTQTHIANQETFNKITKMLTGKKGIKKREDVSDGQELEAFCALLEGHGQRYFKDNEVPGPTLFLGFVRGVGWIFFVVACFLILFLVLMIYGNTRWFIKIHDPRYIAQMADRGTQLAALGTIAASEVMEKQQEKADERRAALMQGQGV